MAFLLYLALGIAFDPSDFTTPLLAAEIKGTY